MDDSGNYFDFNLSSRANLRGWMRGTLGQYPHWKTNAVSPPMCCPRVFLGVGVNTKAKGNRIEHEAMKLLESVGFKCCRSAASLGEWDIVGIAPEWFVVVQCKANRWPPKPERILLEKFTNPSNCIKLEWRRDDRKKPRVRQVSGKNNTPLGEIEGINQLLNEGRIHES